MANANFRPLFAEDEFGAKLDRCLTNTLIKGVGGLVLGSALSLLLFKRRAWPLYMGAGFGTGVSYKACETDLNK